MRFEDAMGFGLGLNEDWNDTPQVLRKMHYKRARREGILPSDRDVHQSQFKVERQKGIGGDAGDIGQMFEPPMERTYRESHLEDVKAVQDKLAAIYNQHLKYVKPWLRECLESMKEMQKENFANDMSSVGRDVSWKFRELIPAVESAYDAISKIGSSVMMRELHSEIPESAQLPFDGASITEMRLSGE